MLSYLLITDGSSDQCLIHIIDWLLRDLAPELEVYSQWANPLDYCPRSLVLEDKLRAADKFYDFDMIFVHRDAERDSFSSRCREVMESLESFIPRYPAAIVIPVRMTEAWLLLDELAIRKAAGNPNGTDSLYLPRPGELEADPDPKETLYSLLRSSCGLPPGRRKSFRPHQRVERVAELTQSFAVLRHLPAFREFEHSTHSALVRLGHLAASAGR